MSDYDVIVIGGSAPEEHPVIVTTFPRTVRVIEHTLIPLRDGTMLAARIWLPDDAEQSPVPAILEYLPYRKRDGTYERDALSHPYLAGHGYAGFAYCDFTRRDITLPIVRSSALQ